MRRYCAHACEQSSPRRGPLLFVHAIAELWQEVGRVSELGDPGRIEEELRQFVGADTAAPKEVGTARAESYHKLALVIAVRVAIAGANVAKAATLTELGATAESLASSGSSDFVQAMAFRDAQDARFDLGSLRRNWQMVRRTVLTIVPGVDATVLCARVREEGIRACRTAAPGDLREREQPGGRPCTGDGSGKSGASDAGTSGGPTDAAPTTTPPEWFAGGSLRPRRRGPRCPTTCATAFLAFDAQLRTDR